MKYKDFINEIKLARFIFTCGNGGSASTAEHFTADLIKKGYKAICLNSNVSVLTMIANDYGYDKIFSKQLEILADPFLDLLITFSVSNKSPNIVKAQKYCDDFKMSNIIFFGEPEDSYAKAENKHLKIAHEVASKL